uniref:Uncharacterized protein n=1 Tax=Oryza brachyantha TaxID=4533 RepID=J3MGR9_ORYBR
MFLQKILTTKHHCLIAFASWKKEIVLCNEKRWRQGQKCALAPYQLQLKGGNAPFQ